MPASGLAFGSGLKRTQVYGVNYPQWVDCYAITYPTYVME
jgi:hypothetical protein